MTAQYQKETNPLKLRNEIGLIRVANQKPELCMKMTADRQPFCGVTSAWIVVLCMRRRF